MARVVKILIVALVAANLIYYGVMFGAYESPWVAVYSLGLLGRAPACPFSQISRGLGEHLRHPKAVERLLAGSRVLQNERSGLSLIATPRGDFWCPGTDNSLTPRLLAQLLAQQEVGIYESDQVKVRPGDVVLDCGAHVGVYTRRALAAGAELVVAIEPAPDNVECLRRNFSSEIGSGRVIVYPKGVWDRDDFMTLYTNLNSAGDSFVFQSDKLQVARHIPVTTIDKLTLELKLKKVDFIKMDIKGAEREALAGARATLAKYKPRLAVAAEHLPDDPSKIPSLVRSARPDYQMTCGSCFIRNFRIVPEALLFY